MSRKCQITGKTAQNGNNVSHSKRRTKKLFNVNLQNKKFYWPEQEVWISLKVSTKAIRTINRKGINAVLLEAAKNNVL